MNADEFQELYKLLRGSKSAMPVLDAKALFSEGKTDAALEKLNYARETFLESRSRLLKQDVEAQVDKKAKDRDRQIKKLKRKQDKLKDTVKVFDEMIPQLEKQAERDRQRAEKAAARAQTRTSPSEEGEINASASENDLPAEPELRPQEVARRSDVSEGFAEEFSNVEGDQRLDVVSRRFGFREVETEEDLCGDSLYLIQAGTKSYLIATPSEEEMAETVAVINVVDDRPIKPFSRTDFLKLGKRRKMVLLTRIDGQVYSVPPPHHSRAAEDSVSDSDSDLDSDLDSEESADGRSILDMGAFSQLLMSAQRCGLVPGADQIGHVRDREFRKEKYDLAFQAIDSMFSRFSAAAGQRTQKLAREDADIASGRIKISPKDLQAKRSRDRAQTQEVERAKRRFQVVLEGLRVLMNTQPREDQAIGT